MTKIHHIFPLLALLFLPLFASAQAESDVTFDAADAAIADSILSQELLLADSVLRVDDSISSTIVQTEIDRLLIDWALTWLDTTACDLLPDTTTIPDSVYIRRLQCLPNDIPLPYNSIVRRFIESYVRKRPRQVASLMRISEVYFPIFEDHLGRYGLPYELKYLPIIESALNASARSHAGAAGLWQFMPSTGKNYGLEVNSLVDERLDPYRSTDAACRMLRSLYNIFGDWHLVLAAYNCGPGNVNKAIRRSGKKTFWDIYPYLPKETRSYVPIFIAANYAFNYADLHGICPALIHDGNKAQQKDDLMPMLTDTILISKRLHLKQISDVLGIPINELRKINPAYIRDVVPGGKDYVLTLPIDYAGAFIEHEDSILAYKADSLILAQKAVIEVAQQTASSSSAGLNYYKVKKGDTLGAIAQRYHCTVKQLMRWNNLKSTNLQIGQKLKIMN